MNISAIIMAAGLSKRMGKDKLHLEIDKIKIYEHILETVKGCNFHEVIVVAKDEDIIEKAKGMGFKAIKNTKSHLGQSMSIKLALKNTVDSDGFMFFVADQPFLKVSTILRLCKEFNKSPDRIIIPNVKGNNKNPIIFPSYLKEELINIQGDYGGKIVIKNNMEKTLKIDMESGDEFFDIDTLYDYNKAVEMIEMKVFYE